MLPLYFSEAASLENKLRAELQNTRVVRTARVQEVVVEAAGIACRIVGPAVTRDVVIDPIPLRMVEDVEPFRAELKSPGFREREALKQSHVEIGARGIVQEVAARVAERQAGRRNEGVGVEEQRAGNTRRIDNWGRRVGITGYTRIRTGTNAIADAGIVTENTVSHGERRSGLERGDAVELPSSQDLVH